MSPLRFFPFVALCVFVPDIASAELTSPKDRTPSLAYVQAGYERSLATLTFGFAHDLDARTVEVPASVFAELRFETDSLRDRADVTSGVVRVGLRVELVRIARFAVPVRAAAVLDIDAGSALHLAMQSELTASPGLYTGRYAFALELGLRSTWGEYADDDNGPVGTWQHVSEQRLRLGVRAGVVLASRMELGLRVGYDEIADVEHGAPTYADITTGIRF